MLKNFIFQAANIKSPALVSDPFTAAAAKKSKKTIELDVEKRVDVEIDTPATSSVPDPANESEPEIVKEEPPSKKAKQATKPKPAAKKKKSEDDDDDEENGENSELTNVKFNKEDFKDSSNGKPYNLKIVSWNINGIRAWLEVDNLESIMI